MRGRERMGKNTDIKLTCLELCSSKSLRLAEEEVGLILTEQRCYYPLAECFCPHCRHGQAHSPVF